MAALVAELCECGCDQRTPLARRTDTQKGWVKGRPLRFINGHQRPKGERHPRWQGDDISQGSVHFWIRRHKTRESRCENCETVGMTDFANVSGEYRRDVDDFIELCRLCHAKFDKERGFRYVGV